MIIPALDLLDGQIVRLYQGNYTKKKIYSINSIINQLEKYFQLGIDLVHLVDLEGAKNPNKKQKSLLKSILLSSCIKIQVGGGIRTEKDIEEYLSYGASRIVLGSSVIESEQDVKNWFSIYGSESIVVALDLKITDKKEIFIHGWKKNTGIVLEQLIEKYNSVGIKHVLCTDISKDGTLQGANVKLYQELCSKYKNICFQSSGGVNSIDDILNLKRVGVAEIIVGKGFLENKLSILEAISCWQKE